MSKPTPVFQKLDEAVVDEELRRLQGDAEDEADGDA